MAYPITKVRTRFESKYIPEPNSGCWLWLDALDVYGYGRLQVKKRAVKAHRTSYELHIGPIQDGKLVCHRCDTRCCVNPDHLFVGTIADNNADMLAKGRHRHGWKPHPGGLNCKAKISEADAKHILHSALVVGVRRSKIAAEMGISKNLIDKLCGGKTWAHIPRSFADPMI